MTGLRKYGFAILAALLLIAALAIGGIVVSPASSYADGPTEIGSASDLIALANFVNGVTEGEGRRDCLGQSYVLTADITLNNTFGVIGKNSVFHGVLDGNGHTVTYDMGGQSERTALVGMLGSSGVVKNLTVKGLISGNGIFGGVVAENSGRVTDCVSYVSFENGAVSGSATGGLVGTNQTGGSVVGCAFAGTIAAKTNVGGVCGTSIGEISSCVNLGSVTASAGGTASYVGGVAGRSTGSLYDCYTRGTMTINAEKLNVGAIVGQSGGARTARTYVVSVDPATDALYPCGSDSTGNVAGKFERVSLYAFLSDEGISFESDLLVRAKYELGYGFLYAPTCLVPSAESGFVTEEGADAFRVALFSGGVGTALSPFTIADEYEWRLFRTNATLYDYENVYVSPSGDLSVGDVLCVGSEEKPFRGTFDGANHSVTVHSSATPEDDVGLFAYVGDGTIKNLTVFGSVLGGYNVGAVAANVVGGATFAAVTNGATVTGAKFVGGLIGKITSDEKTTVSACYNRGAVIGTGASGDGSVGGLIGGIDGYVSVEGGYNYAQVRTENGGTSAIGGIVGEVYATSACPVHFSAILNEGRINASKSTEAGGVIGRITTSGTTVTIDGAVSVAAVTGRAYVGGLMGNASGVSVEHFTVIADVSGRNLVAGVAFASGDLTLTTGMYTGKLTDATGSTGSILDSDAIATTEGGAVTATDVYFGSDDGNASGAYGEGKTGLELTSGSLFENAYMSETAPAELGGTYPVPAVLAAYILNTSVRSVPYFAGKDGDVYLINDEQSLRNFAFLCASETYGAGKYKLTADVTLKRPFVEIPLFKGEFDGNGYIIEQYSRTADSHVVGFFNSLVGATISRFVLYGGRLTSQDDLATVGSIAGEADENTTLTDSYSTLTLFGGETLGGLVGENAGTIERCFFAGVIKAGTDSGGIVGTHSGTIRDCFTVGVVHAEARVGGIAAYLESGSVVEACLVSGRIQGGGVLGGGVSAIVTDASVSKVLVTADFQLANTGGAFFGTSPDAATKTALTEAFYDADFINYLAYPGIVTEENTNHGKANEYFRMEGAGYFRVVGFEAPGAEFNASYDAYYAQILSAFAPYIDVSANTYDELRAAFILKSAEIFIFGRNTASEYEIGGVNNPYVIGDADAFRMLYPLTKYTDFAGKYFYVPHDIDVAESTLYSGYAIGYYSAQDGYAFCGVVYGNPNDVPTISNVYVDKAGARKGGTTTEYLGVFANTETGFVLRNLIFEGTVTGTNAVSGLVGYTHGGVIDNCMSKINVVATAEDGTAGGLVAAASGSVTVTGSVFFGTFTANNAFGLLGFQGQSGLTVTCSHSWYVTPGSRYETYEHNGFGSVLYNYADPAKGELFLVESTASGFGFVTHSITGYNYYGFLMDTEDELIEDINAVPYIPPQDDISRFYCVRFCAEVYGQVVTASGDPVEYTPTTTYATVRLSAYYYIGQKATAELVWSETGKSAGYKFVGIKDREYADVAYMLEPSADDVLLSFTMTDETRRVYLVVEPITAGAILAFAEASGVAYDGTDRAPEVLIDNADVEYYYADGEAADVILRAGAYRVIVRVRDGSGYYVGAYEETYVIAKKELTLGAVGAFEAYYETVYDRSSDSRLYEFTADSDSTIVIGVVAGDSVDGSFTLTYAERNVGTGIGLSVTNASLTNDDYVFAGTTKDLGAVGRITPKRLEVVPDGAEESGDNAYDLYATYTKKAPTVTGTYEISIQWSIRKNGDPATSFDAGEYEVVPSVANAEDENNYTLTYGTIRLTIRPYTVSEENIYYARTEYAFTGASLKLTADNSVTFTAPEVDSNAHAMTLSFYTDAQGTIAAEDFLHSGYYYVRPTPLDANYVVSDSLTPVLFRIVKQTLSSAKLVYTKNGQPLTSGDTVYVEDRIEVAFDETDDVVTGTLPYDASMRVDSFNFTMEGTTVIPVAGGENVVFYVECFNATDYEDRRSDAFTLTVLKKRVAAVLDRYSFTFGDDVMNELTFSYYYVVSEDENGATLGERIEKDEIAGLEEATVDLGVEQLHVGSYVPAFSGGSSNGYSFAFYEILTEENSVLTASKGSIVIDRKAVWVTVEDAGSKVYGEDDPVFVYTLTVREDERVEKLTTLPDGSVPVLKGAIGRQHGENVGEYPLHLGTMTDEANPDYRISGEYLSTARFAITKRPISLTVAESQGKEYGAADEKIRLECVEGEPVVREKLGINDDLTVFDGAIIVTREEGEDIGRYAYTVTYEWTEWYKLNYDVTYVNSDGNRYVIRKATPVVHFEVNGGVVYGEPTNGTVYRATAENARGQTVTGSYQLYVPDFTNASGKRETFEMKDAELVVEFIPDNPNYNVVRTSRDIRVEKRPVVVTVIKAGTDIPADGASFAYSGKTVGVDAFSIDVRNLAEGDSTFEAEIVIEGDAKNVTSDGFTVTATFSADRYEATKIIGATCRITRAIVTVTVKNGSINYGDKYTPVISYDGFVSGENKSVLTKQATVGNVPTESGYYSVTASGAEAKNYEFTYVAGLLVITRKEASDGGVTVKGELAPEYAIRATTADPESDMFADAAEQMDKALGASTFIPISHEMKEYVSLSSTLKAEGELGYSVKFASFGESDKLYVTLANGKTAEVEEFTTEQTADGVIVSFTSESVIGVARYEQKDTLTYVLGFKWLAVIGAAVLVLLILIIVIASAAKKRSKRDLYVTVSAQMRAPKENRRRR